MLLSDSHIIGLTIANSFVIAIALAVSVYRAQHHQNLAYNGDLAAAKRIILPCWKPLMRGLLALFIFLGILQLTIFLVLEKYHSEQSGVIIVQHYGLCLLVVFSIPPVLLMQSSVSKAGFYRCFYILISYYIVCNITWVICRTAGSDSAVRAFEILFFIVTCFPPLLTCIAILSKRVKSRIQLGSMSNRACVEFLVFYVLLYAVLNISAFTAQKSLLSSPSESFRAIVATYSIVVLISGSFFPFALYRTLLADTKFWRGLGKHNQGGIRYSEQIMAGDLSAPTIELGVMSDLQSMIATVGEHLVIDFALLRILDKIGDGATAEVYNGVFKGNKLAVKISTPPEVTPEVIEVFASEAHFTSLLTHPNIVKFYGICIRPPQIAMAVELCGKGDLKSLLIKQSADWTAVRQLRACLDAAKALEHTHAKKLIHRDVKAANFFVGDWWEVKLGDFGESTWQIPESERCEDNRMAILGTVAFMAPELIARGTRHYTEAVDTYAFAVLMWEIWTHGRDPFDDVTTFQLYDLVAQGQRPPLTLFKTPSSPVDSTAPFSVPDDGILEVMQEAWHQEPEKRLPMSIAVIKLAKILHELYTKQGMVEEAAALLEEDRSEDSFTTRLSRTFGQGDAPAQGSGSYKVTDRLSMGASAVKDLLSRNRSGSAASTGRKKSSELSVDRDVEEGSATGNPLQLQSKGVDV
jgi:serine/threonine protein kinase